MKRRWFQIHLSTAVLLMLALGAILYLNVTPRLSRLDDLLKVDSRLKMTQERYGWPFEMAEVNRYGGPADFTIESKYEVAHIFVAGHLLRYEATPGPAAVDPGNRLDWDTEITINTPIWERDKVIWNAVTSLGLLILLVFILEFTIRREARTP